jgi:hypothetical protein
VLDVTREIVVCFRRTVAASSAIALGVAMSLAPHAVGAADKIYNVGIYYDVSPPYAYRFCPMNIRFHAEVGAKLAPGASRDIVYHWETGRGKVLPDHTLTILPDETFTEPTFAPGQATPEGYIAPTPIPRGRFNSSKGLDFHQTHSFRDNVRFVITKPVHEVTDSGKLNIPCR